MERERIVDRLNAIAEGLVGKSIALDRLSEYLSTAQFVSVRTPLPIAKQLGLSGTLVIDNNCDDQVM